MKRCPGKLILNDDWGDEDCTFYCEKPLGHRGKHRRTSSSEWVMEWESRAGEEE